MDTTIRREDYRPPAYLVDRIHLEFDLDPDRTIVTATAHYRRNPAGDGRFRLDGDGLELISLTIDGRKPPDGGWRALPDSLEIDDVPASFVLCVVTAIAPVANTALSGLYASGSGLFTQCEAQGFRAITYFPDRPDVMARYRVSLRASRQRYPVLLSNGNLVGTADCAPGPAGEARHEAVWDDPFPKPSYLFALVAGDLSVREQTLRTASGRDVLLQIWVEHGNADKTGHAMDSLVASIRWDEQRFGLELDLDRFMIVAVSDFNMGAMENKGLNIFNTRYVFATPRIATDADFAGVESVVAHEYFHNWTGNRVTCRDWFQLTLKEGLTVFRDQEFSADMLAAACDSPRAADSARAVRRIEDVRMLRATQFPEDAGPMAHPIRPDAYREINNFYTVTVYEKGAEVIRMLQTLVGRDGFRKGMDRYFARHDGQAVTCDDFVAAIADANDRPLSRFGRWYSQAGTPRLTVSGRFDPDARTWTLDIAQNPGRYADGQALPLQIPFAIGLLGADGHDLPLSLDGPPDEAAPRTLVLDLTESQQRFTFHGIAAEPVPSLLRNFSAPVLVDFPWSTDGLAFLASHDSDPFNRWEAGQRLASQAMLAIIDGAQAAQAAEAVVQAFARVLDDTGLDPAFADLMLTLPSETVLSELLDSVDPDRVRSARDALRGHLADTLAPRWWNAWHANQSSAPYSPDPASAGRRALKNTALWYLVRTHASDAFAAAAAQCAAADNMTDRQAALQALCGSPAPQRDAALSAFARDFADEPLVMDKWFSIQATMHRQAGDPPVVDRVRALMSDPAFSVRNPNKVRALITSFCNGNPAEFHAVDGSGYRFWVERIAELDPLNPQITARLARAMDRWRRYTPDRRAGMRAALEQVRALPTLSNDVREIVDRALGE